MTATTTRLRPRQDVVSPADGRRLLGERVTASPVLDLVERLLRAAAHPDIVEIERYGPGLGPWGPNVQESKVKAITGVRVVHQSTATASLWEAVWPGEQPAEAPEVWPAPRQNRAPRLVLFVNQLLGMAKPAQLKAWRMVTLPELGNKVTQGDLPVALSLIAADGKQHLLRATATGATLGFDPETEPFPDYVIPEEVSTCLLPAGAASAVRS